MKCSFGISDFLEEIPSLSHSIVFLYFFALITEEGFRISSCYSLELCIQMFISFLFSFAFWFIILSKSVPRSWTVASDLFLEWYPWRGLFGGEWRGEKEGLKAIVGGSKRIHCVFSERKGDSKALSTGHSDSLDAVCWGCSSVCILCTWVQWTERKGLVSQGEGCGQMICKEVGQNCSFLLN